MRKKNNTLTIVSRQSRLALQQADMVKQQLQYLYPDLKIIINGISTQGDQILDKSLSKIGGKGLFVKELEHCLLRGEADIAVHSMKDVPTELPQGLKIGAILMRDDPRDVLLSIQHYSLDQLPLAASLGTSSLRRQSQLLAVRNDLKIKELRGNIDTRIKKLLSGEYDAIVLAAAGLQRLALNQWLTRYIPVSQMLPAICQGVLGIECRQEDAAVAQMIQALNHPATANCVLAERMMNARLNGACQVPIGGLANIVDGRIHLQGMVGSPDGKKMYFAELSGAIQDASLIGQMVADKLIAQGADKIISELKLKY